MKWVTTSLTYSINYNNVNKWRLAQHNMKIIHSPTGVYVCVLSERDQNKELYLLSNSIKVYS